MEAVHQRARNVLAPVKGEFNEHEARGVRLERQARRGPRAQWPQPVLETSSRKRLDNPALIVGVQDVDTLDGGRLRADVSQLKF
jgi:hypothetical protein